MSAPVARASGQVQVEYHAFHLADAGEYTQPPFHPENGLIFSRPGLAVVLAGVNSGPVDVTVEIYRRAVPLPDHAEVWDEVVDHSIESLTGDMRVTAMMDALPELPVLTPFGPGPYRARVHARGRDRAHDAHVALPVEVFLLQVWPRQREPDLIHQHNDRYGQSMRQSVQAQPQQVAPPEPAEEDWRRAANERLHRRGPDQ
ncbi:hypothetical protein ACGFOM_28480 [Streptomyces sp. NPDC048594]|uniref:hypothetical protein n=1 Tax=Streptomyces sp. NPDC048594 TaxID=3365575 RepID=UPI0037115629